MLLERGVLVGNGVPYTVALKRSHEGYAVWVPELPGANPQGATEAEAVENIRDAIGEYVAAREELSA